jgi:hypothetical protein
MSYKSNVMKRRVDRFRTFLSFSLAAIAQFLSPTAAADPASKIDPPAWAYNHSRQEIQAYGVRANAQDSDKKNTQATRQARLRRRLMNQSMPIMHAADERKYSGRESPKTIQQ